VSRILVVDDDLGTLETVSAILRLEGFPVTTAGTGEQALEHTRRSAPDLLLADLCLPDFSGLDLLRSLRAEGIQAPAIIMTGFGTIPSALEASRLGALDYLEKPLFEEAIVGAIRKSLTATSIAPISTLPGNAPAPRAAAKWAELVFSALTATDDLRTLQQWGKLQGISRATVENRCAAAGVDAKASLDLARVLRAVVHASQMNCSVEALLDCDPRTLRRLFSAGGLPAPSSASVVPTTSQFLDSQRFIIERLALEALRRALP
jgi:DNA-binding response OmpR family regulator